jgi:hypothetical protein
MILAGTNSDYWIAAKSPYSNEFSCIVNQEIVRYTSTNDMTGLSFVRVRTSIPTHTKPPSLVRSILPTLLVMLRRLA